MKEKISEVVVRSLVIHLQMDELSPEEQLVDLIEFQLKGSARFTPQAAEYLERQLQALTEFCL